MAESETMELYKAHSIGYVSPMPKKPRKLSDQIRQAIADSEHSRYRIAKETELNEGALGAFFHGQRGMSLESLDKLAEFLGLEVVTKRRKGR